MIKKKHLKELLTGKRSLIDVWHYLLGNLRYKLFYSKHLKSFIRSHIFEQIEYRFNWMDIDCYVSGSCKQCGCETTKLQMANKSCEKPCYPEMMGRKQWTGFKLFLVPFKDKHGWWVLDSHRGKPLLILRHEDKAVPKQVS